MIKVYVKLDDHNVIVEINSNIFMDSIEGYSFIDEGEGDKYAHAQSNYLPSSLIDEKGRYNFKYVNDEVVALTEEEKEVLFPPQELAPTSEENQNDFNIDVDYRLSCLELGV